MIWESQRRKVWQRSGGRCEAIVFVGTPRERRCNRLLAFNLKMSSETGLPVMHCHHKKRRGIGGGKRNDDMRNLKAECPRCHGAAHA